jgi:hypothetical protein
VLAPDEGVLTAAEVAPGKRHLIPAVADCRACHESRQTSALGFNALQLSTDRDPNAIHGEPLRPGMVTLATLERERLLRPARPELVTSPPRIATGSPETRAVLGYLSTNCGGCHNGKGDIATLGPSLAPADVLDGDRLARALLRHPTTWQVPGKADGTSVLIDPDTPEASAILARMRSRRPSSQMPPLGTVVADRAALDALATWLATEVPRIQGERCIGTAHTNTSPPAASECTNGTGRGEKPASVMRRSQSFRPNRPST